MADDWPDWMEVIWQREATCRSDLSSVTAEAQHSLADLDALAAETARSDSLTAAQRLFGGDQ